MNSALMLHRHARPAVAGSYLLGAIGGALLSATALLVVSGLLSPIPREMRRVAAIVLIGALAARATGLLPIALPQRRYQIPRETFGPSATRSAFRFAFELGTGVRTYVTASAPYAIVVLLALLTPGSPASALVATAATALGYGIGRSIVVVSQAVRRSVAVDHPRIWLRAADLLALVAALMLAVDG